MRTKFAEMLELPSQKEAEDYLIVELQKEILRTPGWRFDDAS